MVVPRFSKKYTAPQVPERFSKKYAHYNLAFSRSLFLRVTKDGRVPLVAAVLSVLRYLIIHSGASRQKHWMVIRELDTINEELFSRTFGGKRKAAQRAGQKNGGSGVRTGGTRIGAATGSKDSAVEVYAPAETSFSSSSGPGGSASSGSSAEEAERAASGSGSSAEEAESSRSRFQQLLSRVQSTVASIFSDSRSESGGELDCCVAFEEHVAASKIQKHFRRKIQTARRRRAAGNSGAARELEGGSRGPREGGERVGEPRGTSVREDASGDGGRS